MKGIFIYRNDIFNEELLICVGVTAEEIKRWSERNSKILKKIYKDGEILKATKDNIESSTGFVQFFIMDGFKYYILWLKNYNNNWEWIDVLNHEVVHYRQELFKERGISDEREFEAYLHESIFRELRILLNKHCKRK
jgi:3-methyladenine DNA glycosylase AlkD